MPLSPLTIALHWLVALGVIIMVGLGFFISDMPRGPDKGAMIQIHKSIGMIVLFALVARTGWRLVEGWPVKVSEMLIWEQRLSRAAHWLLLALPLVMVITGIIRSLTYARDIKIFGIPFIPKMMDDKNIVVNEIAGSIHSWVAWTMVTILILHVTTGAIVGQ